VATASAFPHQPVPYQFILNHLASGTVIAADDYRDAASLEKAQSALPLNANVQQREITVLGGAEARQFLSSAIAGLSLAVTATSRAPSTGAGAVKFR